MQKAGYQAPELWVLSFEQNDVITESEGSSEGTLGSKEFDKGVVDFF